MEFEPRGRTTRRQAIALSIASVAAMAVPGVARAAHVVKPWPAGKPTPSVALTDLDGKSWDLASLKGHVVALNFWASWCEPCRDEMPSLELLQTREEKSGLTVLAVNYKEAIPAIKRFLDVLPFSLPILLDRDGDTAMAWTPRVFPTTVLIDRSGTARTVVLGELDWMGAEARAIVAPLLAKPKSA